MAMKRYVDTVIGAERRLSWTHHTDCSGSRWHISWRKTLPMMRCAVWPAVSDIRTCACIRQAAPEVCAGSSQRVWRGRPRRDPADAAPAAERQQQGSPEPLGMLQKHLSYACCKCAISVPRIASAAFLPLGFLSGR